MPSRVLYLAGLPVTGQSVGTFSIARLFGKLFSNVSFRVSNKLRKSFRNNFSNNFFGKKNETNLDQKISKNDQF